MNNQSKSTQVDIITYLLLVFFFFAFFIKGILVLDTDFGWHMRMGELILKNGIPEADPFSYTMPSYPFVDHEWLTGVFMYILHQKIGYAGLAFVFALIAFGSLIFHLYHDEGKLVRIQLLIAGTTLLSFCGIRPQVITWFFFSLLLWIIFSLHRWKKYRFLVPVLFLAWANLHGGFVIGIVTLFLRMFLRIVHEAFLLFKNLNLNIVLNFEFRISNFYKKVCFEMSNLTILIVSILATLINPYGIRLWKVVWMHITDTSILWSISEWMPSLLTLSIPLMIASGFPIIFVLRYWKKYQFWELVLFFGLFFAAHASVRHISLWALVSLPVTAKAFGWLSQETKLFPHGLARLHQMSKLLLFFGLLLTGIEVKNSLERASMLSEHSFYPQRAVQYINSHLPRGNIFTIYNWGGYMLWKVPQKKVFIDGRMSSWRWQTPSPKESGNAYKDYTNLLELKTPWKNTIEKNNIHIVLFPAIWLDKRQSRKKQNYAKQFIRELQESGMREIYRDSRAILYQKNY